MSELLREFQKFWALHSEKYLQGVKYLEAGPHFLLTAFLRFLANGGATVINEFADGLGYADLVVLCAGRSYPIELKIKDNEASRAKSLEQLLGYMNHLLTKEGWL
ncbi:MAG: ATP-binding protein, partial [Deltaproteobacteria bacterium]|nr:ATP-binding protein [Deltaproteobacteria bacterium]